MQNAINALAGFNTISLVADIAFDEGEARPLVRGNEALNFIQVVLVAGGEIVQADYFLIQFEKVFQEV